MKILSEPIKKQNGYQMLDEYSPPIIPLSNEERRKTDRWFFFVFIFCIIVLGIFPLIFVLSYADINRYNGYDKCGNICGQMNRKYDQWDCTGQDSTLKPFHTFSQCLTEEQYNDYGYSSWMNQKSISTRLQSLATLVAIAFFVPFGFCLILAVLFRYAASITVWLLPILCWLIIPGSSLYTWLLIGAYPIFLAVYIPTSLLMICVLVAARRKIALVITMLREASKIVFSTPRIILNAMKTSIMSFTLIVSVSLAAFLLKTSGVLTEVWSERLDYIPNSYMVAANCLFGVIALWEIMYVIGVGFVNTSADIANKYFSRKEENNAGPTSRYHAGTIALVSLLSGIMAIPRLVLATLAQISVLQNLMDLCLRYVDGYFTKNAYVATAMHGTSFAQSGKKAVKLSKESVGNTLSALNFADYLLILTQIVVTVAASVISLFLYNEAFDTVFDYLFVCIVAFISSELVLGHVKVAMSTIFFCVCQDNLLEKEANKSYTMGRDEYLVSSDKFFAFKTKEKWQPSNLSTA